jgi:transposase
MLPRDFPKWEGVYATFRRWAKAGLFEEMNTRLAARWRARVGKEETPTAAIVDSQSVRTSPQGGPAGIDANKKIKGRKRHLVVDTLGLLLAVTITAASVQDPHAAPGVVAAARQKYPTIRGVFADSAYQGKCAKALRRSGLDVQIVRRADRYGLWTTRQCELPVITAKFQVLPKRWIIERTNAWISNHRRLARDYDRLLSVSEAWLWLSQGRNLLRRFA